MSTAAGTDRVPSHEEVAGIVGGLFQRHGRMVYGICRAMLRDVHEAEDAAQQAFLSAHKALLAGAAVRDPGGWLATIARNECRRRIASGMRQPLPVADEDLYAIPSGGDDQARRAQVAEIRAALAQLPDRQREAVVLRYLYGLRYGEVATALGLSRPATEALLFRARRALRVSLRPVAAVLAVPVALREELALALPGFESRSAPVAVGAGIAGGLVAKLTAGSVGVKVATTAAAVATVGTVGSVSSERPPVAPPAAAVLEQHVDVRESTGGDDATARGEDTADRGSSREHGADTRADGGGAPGGSRDDDVDRSGPAARAGQDHAARDDDSESSGSGERRGDPDEDTSDEPSPHSGSDSMSPGSGSSRSGATGSSDSDSGSGSGSSNDDAESESDHLGSSGSGSGSSDSAGSADEPPDEES